MNTLLALKTPSKYIDNPQVSRSQVYQRSKQRMNINNSWRIYSWKDRPAYQQPIYPDQGALTHICTELSEKPALVESRHVKALRLLVAKAASGKAFILQGGDCAETFHIYTEQELQNKLHLFKQMASLIEDQIALPVIKIGRIAGQYAKPRSFDFEEHASQMLPVFRGENVHSYEKSLQKREPNPYRLLKGYEHSLQTINYLKNFAKKNPKDFLFTSHEGLLLDYESAMTRWDEQKQEFFNLGAHMLWIGDKTRQLDGAHVEYFRGIANPIGIKIGPEGAPEDLISVIKKLNPNNEQGRILLITRFGKNEVQKKLPELIQKIKKSGLFVCWICDPMHGNTIKVSKQTKTRHFDDICSELKQSFLVHRSEGTFLSGVHFEMTHELVTECLGGPDDLQEKDLSTNYTSYCDPRLNGKQSIAICHLISNRL